MARDQGCTLSSQMGTAEGKAEHLLKSASNEKAPSSFLCLLSRSQESERAVSHVFITCTQT